MHIPDGLIAPQAWLAATAVAVPFWAYASRRVARELDEQHVPRMAVLTALALVLSTIMLPLPGGTSAHLIGNGLVPVWASALVPVWQSILMWRSEPLSRRGTACWPGRRLAGAGRR